MTDSAKAEPRPRWPRAAWLRSGRLRERGRAAGSGARAWWVPVWSTQAAMRAVRATLVMPALFALTYKVIGDPQMTLFAVFGSFATLVMASFGGTRRDKAIAHFGLAVVGSAALTIGTLVSGIAWLATLVTVPVTFAIFFAGVAGPNTASGITAALLAYVLPVASLAEPGTIPSRLAGWWMASAAGTLAVLLLSPRSPQDRLRATASAAAATLARHIEAALGGTATPDYREASLAARHDLKTAFASGPFRPTGLTVAGQGLANVIELLEWCAGLVTDTLDGHVDLARAAPADLDQLKAAADLLTSISALLHGEDVRPDTGALQAATAASVAYQRSLTGDPDNVRAIAAVAAHAHVIAVAVRATTADALIAAAKAGPDLIAAERRRWYGQPGGPPGEATDGSGPRQLPAPAGPGLARSALTSAAVIRDDALADAAGFIARHASLRSVWFRNSARGAIALAAAVAVAYATGVQHGFWVILGTLSVLRTTAASTGSTAIRALGGTVAGFVIGAALLLAIGTSPAALWIALPFAVVIASYAPGTTPFVVGQAAFTVAVVVIFNLLVPAGWKVGLLRIEDVALGCAVSLVVGVLFWPRGAAAIVGDDLADAFRYGGAYLSQAVDWALGLRPAPPDAALPAVTASSRLDEALRAFLAEQGAKHIPPDDMWHLVMAATRLRLTAYAVASLPAGRDPAAGPEQALAAFQHLAAELAGFYGRVADEVGPPGHEPPAPVTVPDLHGPGFPQGVACAGNTPPDYRPDMLWVGEHLYHLATHAQAITEPAEEVAKARHRPWWR